MARPEARKLLKFVLQLLLIWMYETCFLLGFFIVEEREKEIAVGALWEGFADSTILAYGPPMVLKTSDFLAFVSRFPELASAMETCRAEQLGRYNDRRKTRRMTVARRSPKDLLKSWGNASKASMRMGKSRQDFRRAPTSESTDDGAATKDGLHEASLHSESALVRYDATRSTGM